MRAYSSACKEALASSTIITKIEGFKLKIKTDYTGLGKIQYILGQRGIPVIETVYAEQVELYALTAKEEERVVCAGLIEGTNGKVQIERVGICWFAKIEGEIKILKEY